MTREIINNKISEIKKSAYMGTYLIDLYHAVKENILVWGTWNGRDMDKYRASVYTQSWERQGVRNIEDETRISIGIQPEWIVVKEKIESVETDRAIPLFELTDIGKKAVSDGLLLAFEGSGRAAMLVRWIDEVLPAALLEAQNELATAKSLGKTTDPWVAKVKKTEEDLVNKRLWACKVYNSGERARW